MPLRSMMNIIERVLKGASLFGLWPSILMSLTPLRNAYNAAHFAGPRRRGPALWLAAWRSLTRTPALPSRPLAYSPGPALAHSVRGQTVTVECRHALLHVTVLAADLVRVQLQRPGEELDVFSYAIAKPDGEWPMVDYHVDDLPGRVAIRSGRLVCAVSKDDGRVSFEDAHSGETICCDKSPLGWQDTCVSCSIELPASAHLYGLGEKAFGLDRRGHTYEMWNDDPNGAYGQGKDPIYLNIPFFLVSGASAWGLFFDNTHRSDVDAAATGEDALHIRAAGGPLRYYFFYGPQVSSVLERYTELTGRLRLPPLWALGYHQSRWSYTPDSRVREVAQQFRSRRIPCEAIHLDIHYMDGYRCFTWHPRRFPDPVGLIKGLHDQGFKVIPLIDCGVKSDRSYAVCRDGLERKAFCAFPDGALFRGPVWPGDCYFPDFTSAQVRAWWGEQHRGLLDAGVDGIWNDMNEPTVFGPVAGTMPDCVRHDWDGQGADHARAHNVYGLLMARASAEGLAALRPDRRTFVITRSAWAGLQRHAMNWMGDNISSWENLRLTIPMIANLGLSGLAFTGPDTGGFAGHCEPELLTRWLQLGVFTPFLRNHAAMGTADQEPWAHGEPYTSINRRSIELRYHLLPYIYTAFWQCSQSGRPMLRPLFYDWPDDHQARSVDDEFMFGDALLVAPVMQAGERRRDVYLPAGLWYDWWTGARHEGGQAISVDAPLQTLPIFARAGSVVPGWPIMQHCGERPVDALTLHVFPGSGESVLYEDDGQSMAYQQGQWSVTRLVQRDEAGGLAISRHSEGAYTPVYDRVDLVVHGLEKGTVQSVLAGGQAITGWQQDAATRTLRCRAPLADAYIINVKG